MSDHLNKSYSGPVQPSEYADTLLNLEPGLVYPTIAGELNATLRLTINENQTVDIPLHEVQRPLRGLNPEGGYTTSSEFSELQIYGVPAEGYATVLGKAFLSQVDNPSPNFGSTSRRC